MIAGHLIYLSIFALVVLSIPANALSHVSDGLIVVGVIGIWRYGWAMINYLRAVIYRTLAYPRMKARAFAAHAAEPVHGHAYFLVTSYKIEAETTRRSTSRCFARQRRPRAVPRSWPRSSIPPMCG